MWSPGRGPQSGNALEYLLRNQAGAAEQPLADGAVAVAGQDAVPGPARGDPDDRCRLLEPDTSEVTPGQVGAREISVVEVREPQRAAGEVGSGQVRSRQVRVAEIEVGPPVPGRSPPV